MYMLCYFTTSHRDSDILSRYVLFCFHCNIKLLLVFLIAKVYIKHTPVVQLSLTSELQKTLIRFKNWPVVSRYILIESTD